MSIGRGRRDDERGAISVMAAMMTLAAVLATSLAVDVGRVAYVSRDQQGVTDRAALDTIHELRDHDASTLSELFTLVSTTVGLTMDRNPGSNPTAADTRQVEGVVLGTEDSPGFAAICGVEPTWMQDQRTAEGQAQVPDCTTADSLGTHGMGDVSAVEVFTTSDVPYLFAIGAAEAARTVDKRARASFGNPVGTVSAASTAVDLNDGLATQLLSRLLGADADLDLIGWNGLANADVSLRQIGTQLGVGSLEQVLDAQVTVAELASVIASVLTNESADPDVDVQTTLLDIVQLGTEVTLGTVRLGDVLLVDPASGSSALDATVDASSLLMALGQQALVAAAVANGENFATIDLAVLDLAGASVQLIEAPQVAIGRPGMKDATTWHTQARTAQARLNLELPLNNGTVAPGAGSYSPDDFRSRIDNAGNCVQASSIESDIEDAIDAYEQAGRDAGLLVSVLDAVLSPVTGLLGGVIDCLTPMSMIREDLHELVDAYEDLVAAVAGVFGPDGSIPVAENPVLSVRLASGAVALDTIACTNPYEVGVAIEGSLGDVVLTSTARLDPAGGDPTPVPVTLLDMDLGVFGRLSAILGSDVELGSWEDTHLFAEPLPSTSYVSSAGNVGLDNVLDDLQLSLGGTQVLGLPIGDSTDPIVQAVLDALGAVLAPVDSLVSSTLDVLGVDLAELEARVLGATCEGPPRLLPNP